MRTQNPHETTHVVSNPESLLRQPNFSGWLMI